MNTTEFQTETAPAVWPTAESLAETMKSQILETIAISEIPAAPVFSANQSPQDLVMTYCDTEDEFPAAPMFGEADDDEVRAFHDRAQKIYEAAEALVVAWLDANGPVADAAADMKAEILADIASGKVPATVPDFSALHDYVDANEYGGFCDEDRRGGWSTDDLVAVQGRVDAWLRAGRPEVAA